MKPSTMLGITNQQGTFTQDWLTKADAAFQAGDTLTGLRQAIPALVPIFGPRMAEAGDAFEAGETARGFGILADLGVQLAGPKALSKLPLPKTVGIPKLGSLNPAEAKAVAFGQARGVPVDAATATGNPAVRAVQHLADRSIGGSLVSGRAANAQAEGLAALGDQLASRGYREAVTKEAAGDSLRGAVSDVVRSHAREADVQYAALRDIEASPARASEFTLARNPDPMTGAPREVAPFFAPRGAPQAAVFDAVYADAVKQGWKGSKRDLRSAFHERLSQAKDLGGELSAVADDFSNEALLKEVRKIGLRPALKEGAGGTMVRGDFATLVNTFREGKWRQGGGASVFRKDGKPIDELVQQLNADPRFEGLTPQGLMARLSDIAAAGRSKPKIDLEGLLSAVDVKPGRRWWDGRARSARWKDSGVQGWEAGMTRVIGRMLTVAEMRELLGPKAASRTDEELTDYARRAYAMVRVLLEERAERTLAGTPSASTSPVRERHRKSTP